MGRAKEIRLKVIASKPANDFIKKNHYSGKVVNNSILHFGAFLDDRLHGVLSFGSSLDKRKMLGLVKGTLWNEFLELNRMAFDETLPKYSESRCIAIAMRLIRKNSPHIKWVVSFADGTQCGDGTIYRASGFVLTKLSEGSMIELPEKFWKINGGRFAHRMTLQAKSNIMYGLMQKELNLNGAYKTMEWYADKLGTKVLQGFQLRYIYFLHPNEKQNLTVPILPFSRIDEMGAGMYKGQKRKIKCGDIVKEQVSLTSEKVAV